MSLGSRLKNEREKRNWSQLFVADKIGITNAVLSNYERDIRDPDTDTLKRLADLYEVKTDWLLGRTDNPNPDEPRGNFFYFDKDGLTEDESELLEQTYSMVRERARKRAEEKKNKENKK